MIKLPSGRHMEFVRPELDRNNDMYVGASVTVWFIFF